MGTLTLLTAAIALAVTPQSSDRTFRVAGKTFAGSNQTVCSIRGQWANGEEFRYQAWDSCQKLRIEWVAAQSVAQTVEQIFGNDRTFIIPAGADGLIISNEASAVHIFRNENGDIEEILVSD